MWGSQLEESKAIGLKGWSSSGITHCALSVISPASLPVCLGLPRCVYVCVWVCLQGEKEKGVKPHYFLWLNLSCISHVASLPPHSISCSCYKVLPRVKGRQHGPHFSMQECQCLILRRERESYRHVYISIFVKSAAWGRTLTQRTPAFRLLVLITVFSLLPTHSCPIRHILALALSPYNLAYIPGQVHLSLQEPLKPLILFHS